MSSCSCDQISYWWVCVIRVWNLSSSKSRWGSMIAPCVDSALLNTVCVYAFPVNARVCYSFQVLIWCLWLVPPLRQLVSGLLINSPVRKAFQQITKTNTAAYWTDQSAVVAHQTATRVSVSFDSNLKFCATDREPCSGFFSSDKIL